MRQCIECKGETEQREIDMEIGGVTITHVPARVCMSCGLTYYAGRVAETVYDLMEEAQARGMRVSVYENRQAAG